MLEIEKVAFEAGQDAASAQAGLSEAQIARLRAIARPGLLERTERLFVRPPVAPVSPETAAQAQSVLKSEQTSLRKAYGIRPKLFGSMATGLNVPGDVDIDMFTHVPDKAKFEAAVQGLTASGKYRSSVLNKPGAALQVFKRDAAGPGDYPIDVVLGYGDDAAAFAKQINERSQAAAAIPEDIKRQIIERKRYYRHSYLDPGKRRYTAFKQELDRALTPHPSVQLDRGKIARVLDPSNPDDAAHLEQFLSAPNLYGHRSTNAESILSSGEIMPGLEALRRGMLKDYEHGFLPGMRSEFKVPELDPDQARRLSAAVLQRRPDGIQLRQLAEETGSDPLALKGALIRHRPDDVNRFLGGLGDKAENWRLKNLRIPKLSPNIFLTEGGLVDDKGYGDVGFLLHTDKAQQSPYMTMVNHEAVVAPKQGLEMQTLNARKGLVVAPQEKLQALEQAHPEYTYVPEHALPKEKLLSAISAPELGRRVLPRLAEGTLRVRQG